MSAGSHWGSALSHQRGIMADSPSGAAPAQSTGGEMHKERQAFAVALRVEQAFVENSHLRAEPNG